MRKLKTIMRNPMVIDLRNIYSAAEIAREGFTYVPLGKRSGAIRSSGDNVVDLNRQAMKA
jgi:UDPglucose 6-dehydrogenase